MAKPITYSALEQVFLNARSHNAWQDRKIDDVTLKQLYELSRWPPTSMNSNPARFVFVVSDKGRARLRPALLASNIEKTMTAPLTVIVATDTKFYERLPMLFPHKPDIAKMYTGNLALADETAFRNSTLQGAYLLLAARALGLDCGPMSGFDNKKIDDEFFPDSGCHSNFLINIGYAADGSTRPRGPRLSFEQAVDIC